MEMRIHIREWHGVDLTTLPSAAQAKDQPAGPEIYSEFYAALNAGKGSIPPDWIRGKSDLGSAIGHLFADFEHRHGRGPSILAVGAGAAHAEGVWIEGGRDVTLNEWQEDSLAPAKARWPHVKTLLGDARHVDPERKFDFVTMLTMDYTMRIEEFTALLSACRGWLTPEGSIVIHCASVLSLRRMAVESIRHLAGTYRKNTFLFWGYWRTPAVLCHAAECAGYQVASSHWISGGSMLPVPRWLRRLPPLRESNMIFVIQPK